MFFKLPKHLMLIVKNCVVMIKNLFDLHCRQSVFLRQQEVTGYNWDKNLLAPALVVEAEAADAS